MQPAPAAAHGPVTAGAAVRPTRILVAEDDRTSADILRKLLQRAGYEVTVASHGSDALRILEQHELPDALLLDWMLPDLSGLEICHRVRQQWDALALPVLMVTGRADAESISAAFDAGASDYITKPFLGAELRARVASHLRTKQLVEEQRRIEEHLREREKLSALGLLVSSAAHDLSNPLGGISGSAQLLLQAETDAQKRQDLCTILGEVERCRRIVGNLLRLARRQEPSLDLVDVATLLRDTLELRQYHLRARGVELRLELDDELPPVVADGHQLQQAFLNIVLNAEHALAQGGRRLSIGARAEAGALVVDLFNDGPPIPGDLLEHIFSPFFTTKEKDEGTGLGLTISRRVLQEHGGDIDVESGDGGTTFRLRIPLGSAT